MKHKDHYIGPVLAGAALATVLSLIPFVNYCNFIFCMWMLIGAGLAVYLVQNKVGVAIEPGEGAAIGGITGAVSGGLIGVLYFAFFALFGAAMIPGLEGPQAEETGASIGIMVAMGFGSCFGSLFVFGLFGALGGLAGSQIFKPTTPTAGGPPAAFGAPQGGQAFGAPPGGQGGPGFGSPPQGPQGPGFGQPPGGGTPPPAGGFGQPPGGGTPPPGGGGFGQPPGGGTPPPGGGGFGQPPGGGTPPPGGGGFGPPPGR